MRCDQYRRYSFGEVSEDEFAEHRGQCPECDEAARLDAMIEGEARELPAPDSAPGLWDRIAADIRREELVEDTPERQPTKVLQLLDPRRTNVWRLAAVLVVTVGLATVGILVPVGDSARPTAESGIDTIITDAAIARVEATETQYEAAIAELEMATRPVLSALDVELSLRYRERLETIDTQIRRCETVLAKDNGNAHVRRYLLAALQDKRDTLTHLSTLAQLEES